MMASLAKPTTRTQRYTSNQAARVSGVPFFTVDYWDRSRFLRPSYSTGGGRGRGRERLYSYADILRLRIARELRDQHVSLQTLRYVVSKLAPRAGSLQSSRYVLVGRTVELAATFTDLVKLLKRPGKRTFGFILDLAELKRSVEERARQVKPAEGGPGRTQPARIKSGAA